MQLFSKQEISEKLNVSVRTIDRLIKSQEIKALKIGRSVRIAQVDLDEYLKRSTLNPLSPGEVTTATGFSFDNRK